MTMPRPGLMFLIGMGGLALSLPVTPLFADTDPTAKIIADSRSLLNKGDWKTALLQLKKVVKEYPESGAARYELGVVELLTGDYYSAERELTLARDYHYPANQVTPKLAWTLLYLGKIDDLLKTVTPCPDDTACQGEVLSVQTRAALQLKKVDDADALSLAALQADPDSAATRLARSLVLSARGDNAGAEQAVDLVLATSPKQTEALTLKGDLRRRAADYAGAEKSYRAALTAAPNDVAVRVHLAMAIISQNRLEEARAEIDGVLRQAPKSVLAVYLKALLLTRTDKIAAALETIRPFEKEIAQDPQGTFLLAMIHAGNNNMEEALKYAGTYHAAVPDNLIGTLLLAKIDFRMRAYDKVVALLAPLRDQLGDNAEALDLLGSSYLAEGRIKDANEMLTEVVRLRPDDPTVRGRLALSHTRQATTREEGIHELEDLVNRDPKSSQFGLTLIATHLGNRDYDRAIAAATAMISRQPADPLPLTLRGSAKLAKGDETAAAADFAAALAINPNFVPAALYQAEMEMRGGRFDAARAAIDPILKSNPADLRALLARAQIEQRAGRDAAALTFLEQAIAAHPDEIEPRAGLLQTLGTLHDAPRLSRAANDLARTMPNNPTALDLAAWAFLQLGKTDDAIALYRQMQNSFPQSLEVSLRLGQVLRQAGNLTDARTALDRALQVNAASMPAWVERIALEKQMNGADAAIALARKAQKDNLSSETASFLLGDTLRAEGRLAEAESAYEETGKRKPSSLLTVRLYEVVLKQGDGRRARRLMEDWLAKHPDDVYCRSALAVAELDEKDYRAAAEQFAVLTAKLPTNAIMANNLAWAYDALHDPRAVETARQAYQLAPGEPQIVDTYGYILYHGGDRQQGARLLRQAYGALPADPQISYHMARVLTDANDAEAARKLLKPIVDGKIPFAESEDAKKLYSQLGGI